MDLIGVLLLLVTAVIIFGVTWCYMKRKKHNYLEIEV